MSSAQPHPNQHYRLSIEMTRRDYADGLITAAGLLYYCVGVLRKRGQRVAMPVRDWLDLTGLKERTFYKAKAKLIATGRLEERITGSVELWMSSAIAGIIEPQSSPTVQDCPSLPEDSMDPDCPTVQEDCPIVPVPTQSTVQADCPIVLAPNCPTVQQDCPIVQSDCPNGQVVSPNGHLPGPIVRNQQAKASTNKRFSDSPDKSNRTNKPTLQKKMAGVKSVIRKLERPPEIPRDLRCQLEQLEILDGSARDAGVLRAIASEDISKAYGAARQVEGSLESCTNPPGLFLFKLANQPVERLGPIQPVRTAAEFKLPIAALKQRYPPGVWQDAALAYGYSEEEINDADG
ncbi:hypothetical protein [Laspinema palackyanum]|uniref:hypothetical protein n=1 Tax=Laspinema palackyanum TaxID=3231601 RepID=UPI00345CB752|nr:hypothetical protein [Laspinema sp. D2c]